MNPRLVMLCPSRGRPGNVAGLREAWAKVTGPEAELLVAVDADDPDLPAYAAGGPVRALEDSPHVLGVILNGLAMEVAPRCEAVGFLGDDHRPRTPGWAVRLLGALDGRPGVAYGDDLHQGEALPTAVVISSAVILTLGYMTIPAHLHTDTFWYLLGEDLGCRAYCPDVIIEHLHPCAGKASWDEGYLRVNGPGREAADRRVLTGHLAGRWPDDLARLRDRLAVAR
jgi:hypothetical protein